MAENYSDVISFWFEETNPKQWFVKDPSFDEMIHERFSSVHRAAACGELFGWRNSVEGCLAEIIVLDQFSRNMYRDTPRAFSNDTIALVLAQQAVELGLDKAVSYTHLTLPTIYSV